MRLTAQRILTEHLRDDRAKGQPSADPPGSRFWEHIRLDLAGALHFDQARILSPGASHLWPAGWHLTVAGSTGYTVIRSDGDGGS